MNYIKRPDMPIPLIRALKDSSRKYGVEKDAHLEKAPEHDFEISVTTLCKSPRQLQLYFRHHHEITVDPLEYLWYSLQGNIIHYILEKYANDERFITELRIGKVMMVEGERVYIHGQLDLYDKETRELTDWKYCSGMAAVYENPDYHFQLNALRWIAYGHEQFPWVVETLQNVKLFRHLDKARSNVPGYPTENAMFDPIDKWSKQKIESEIIARAKNHLNARHMKDDDLPFCTDEEKWQRGSEFKVFAMMKDGSRLRKTSSFSGESKEQAEQYVKEKKLAKFSIIEKKAVPIRCININFCPIGGFCNQNKIENK